MIQNRGRHKGRPHSLQPAVLCRLLHQTLIGSLNRVSEYLLRMGLFAVLNFFCQNFHSKSGRKIPCAMSAHSVSYHKKIRKISDRFIRGEHIILINLSFSTNISH